MKTWIIVLLIVVLILLVFIVCLLCKRKRSAKNALSSIIIIGEFKGLAKAIVEKLPASCKIILVHQSTKIIESFKKPNRHQIHLDMTKPYNVSNLSLPNHVDICILLGEENTKTRSFESTVAKLQTYIEYIKFVYELEKTTKVKRFVTCNSYYSLVRGRFLGISLSALLFNTFHYLLKDRCSLSVGFSYNTSVNPEIIGREFLDVICRLPILSELNGLILCSKSLESSSQERRYKSLFKQVYLTYNLEDKTIALSKKSPSFIGTLVNPELQYEGTFRSMVVSQIKEKKLVLITGVRPKEGLGIELVRYFLKRGYPVLFTCKTQELVQQVTQELHGDANIQGTKLDLSCPKDIESIASTYTKIKILINNASSNIAVELGHYMLATKLKSLDTILWTLSHKSTMLKTSRSVPIMTLRMILRDRLCQELFHFLSTATVIGYSFAAKTFSSHKGLVPVSLIVREIENLVSLRNYKGFIMSKHLFSHGQTPKLVGIGKNRVKQLYDQFHEGKIYTVENGCQGCLMNNNLE